MTISESQEHHIKRLEWAIWLSQVKLDDFREGDWVNLRQDLKEHIASSFAASIAGVVPIPREHVEDLVASLGTTDKQRELERVQRAIKQDLRNIAYAGEDEEGDMLPVKTSAMENISATVEGYRPDEPFEIVISSQPGTGPMIQRAVYEDLVGSGILRRQLRVCPICETIFLMKRKPRADMRFHCSLKCSRVAATRRYRKNLAKERERSRRRYVAKQRKKHPNANIKRFPRVK